MQPAAGAYRPIAYGNVHEIRPTDEDLYGVIPGRKAGSQGRALVLSQTLGLPFAVRRKNRTRRISKT